ncbi:arginyltransferase [Ningiella sp. W23]|uniref:arginyltransferase n=1 Tax=Ningiella sp. W23 TaxID=3023715 RepID=UPI003757294B
MTQDAMKFGITQRFSCNYIDNHEEQLLVCMSEPSELPKRYTQLLHAGFRRSGEQLYRPHCPNCNRCQSVRIIANEFKPSKSQKRILNKNKDLDVRFNSDERDDYYPLYERYIEYFHADGTMFPPSYQQYSNFIRCQWQQPSFLEARDKSGELRAIAITDIVGDGLSALYTYYCPEDRKRSLGKFMIMQQIKHAIEKRLPFVYLGYQIDDCQKMNYKTAFLPYQRLIDKKWQVFR